jgi:hypothetical protein
MVDAPNIANTSAPEIMPEGIMTCEKKSAIELASVTCQPFSGPYMSARKFGNVLPIMEEAFITVI